MDFKSYVLRDLFCHSCKAPEGKKTGLLQMMMYQHIAVHVSHRMRNPTVRLGVARRSAGKRQAKALSLGMSFAAFASLVVEKKSASGQNTNVADLALIYASAVKESLAKVYGHKLGSFAERSFNSTLRILKVTNDSAFPHQSDNLEKSKLEKGASEAALKAEILKTELEDDVAFEMGTLIMNWLVSSIISTMAWMLYVSSVYSFSIYMALKDESSYWWQVSLIMYFAVLMILVVVTYLIIHCSSGTKQRMPVPYNLLFLGIVSGLTGLLCVDTLDGTGNFWLFVWVVVCRVQQAVDVSKLGLFGILYGPVNLIQGTNSSSMVPYWARGGVILVVTLLVLHLIAVGHSIFAISGEWSDHFSVVTYEIKSWWFGL